MLPPTSPYVNAINLSNNTTEKAAILGGTVNGGVNINSSIIYVADIPTISANAIKRSGSISTGTGYYQGSNADKFNTSSDTTFNYFTVGENLFNAVPDPIWWAP